MNIALLIHRGYDCLFPITWKCAKFKLLTADGSNYRSYFQGTKRREVKAPIGENGRKEREMGREWKGTKSTLDFRTKIRLCNLSMAV